MASRRYAITAKGRGGEEGRIELPTTPRKIEEFLEGIGARRAPAGAASIDPYFAGYAVTGGEGWKEDFSFSPGNLISAFALNDLATIAADRGDEALAAARAAAEKASEHAVMTPFSAANFLIQADEAPTRPYEAEGATPEERFAGTVLGKTTVGETLAARGIEADTGAFAGVPLSQALALLGAAEHLDAAAFAKETAFPGKTVVLREDGYAVPEDDFRPDPERYSPEDIRLIAAAARSGALVGIDMEDVTRAADLQEQEADAAEEEPQAQETAHAPEAPAGEAEPVAGGEEEGRAAGEKRPSEWSRAGYDLLVREGPAGTFFGYVAVPEGHPMHGVEWDEAMSMEDSEGARFEEIAFSGRIDGDDRWWAGLDAEDGLDDCAERTERLADRLAGIDPLRAAALEEAAIRKETAAPGHPARKEIPQAANVADAQETAPAAGGEKPAPAPSQAAQEQAKTPRANAEEKKDGPKRTPKRRDRDREDVLAEKQASLRRAVCEQLADDIEKLGQAWTKKWTQPAGMPQNPATGGRYGGGNAVALMCAARQKGFSDNRWCTYDDALDMGWHVRKGEKGTRVEHWEPVDVDDGLDPENPDRTGHVTRHMKLHSIRTVFNLEQIDGAPQLDLSNPDASRATSAEAVLAVADALEASSRCGVDERSSSRAFYSPAADGIVVPKREQFPRPEAFVSTLLREMARSTAPALGRPTATPAANRAAAAKEELTAELSSMIAAASLGVGYDAGRPDGSEKRTASLELCADAMRHDPDVLFRCAGNAQRAANLVVERFDAVAAQRGLSRPAPEKLERPTKTRPARAATAQKTESLDDKLAAAKTSCEAVNAHRGGGHGGHGDDPR